VLPDKGGPGLLVSCSAGAVITASWGAVVLCQATADPQGVHLDSDSKLEIPPGTNLCVLADRIALPGGSDVLVDSASAIYISHDDPAAVLTVPASEVTAAKDHPGTDVRLPFPVCVVPPAGAKITVAGVAAVDLPSGTKVAAPYTRTDDVADERLSFRLPQGTNSLAGTMGMVLLAAMVTIFGAGA